MMERTNTDLDLIDNAVDELHYMLDDKSKGVGIIRVEDDQVMAEYYGSIEQTKGFPGNQNLVMTMAEDNLDRKSIRKVCYDRYDLMRNEH
jgi:hypothetical protein